MTWAEFDAEAWIEARILSALPKGTSLRDVRPDMVSLADVAGKLKVKRQALQKRDMPLPYFPGYYRVTEVAATIQARWQRVPASRSSTLTPPGRGSPRDTRANDRQSGIDLTTCRAELSAPFFCFVP